MNQEEKSHPFTLDRLAVEKSGQAELIASLERVVTFTRSSTSGGADALARLLLACYDASEYLFDITELCRLDDDFYEDALKVIRLRTRFNREPHEFFHDGGRLFNELAKKFHLVPKSEQNQEA